MGMAETRRFVAVAAVVVAAATTRMIVVAASSRLIAWILEIAEASAHSFIFSDSVHSRLIFIVRIN